MIELGRNRAMSETTYSRSVTIVNDNGLHLRPAKLFVELASQFECKLEVVKNDMRIDGKSILSIMTLGATQGTEVRLEGSGHDSQSAVDALVELVETGFPSPETDQEAVS